MQNIMKVTVAALAALMLLPAPASADFETLFASGQTAEQPAAAELVIAVGGYDPTLYFAGGLPKKGKPEINHVYEGQIYYFTSYASKQAFVTEPTRYAPQYGGHCAFAMSDHKTVAANPAIFAVKDNKLFLFENEIKRQMWETNSLKLRIVADKRWELEAKNFSKYTAKF